MKKQFLALLLIALQSIVLSAQEKAPVKIKKSDVFIDDVKNSFIVLGEKTTDDGIVIVRSYKSSIISPSTGYYIEQYDKDLKLLKEFDYKIKHTLSQKSALVLGIFYANNSVNIIEIYFDLKEKTYICQANIIDDNFKITNKELFRVSKEKMKELGSFNLQQKYFESNSKNLPDIKSGDFDTSTDKGFSYLFFGDFTTSRINKSDISIVINEDKSAYSILLDYKNDTQEGFLLYLFDAKSNQQFYKEQQFQTKEKDYILQNFQVSNDGKSVYVLAKNYNIKNKNKKYSFELTEISSVETKTKKVEIENKFIKSLKLNFQNNAIYCVGFYSEVSYKDNDGVCFFKFNTENLNSEIIKFNPFTKQFIQDKFGKESDKDIKDLKIKTILFDNNEVVLNAEEVFEVTNNAQSGFGNSSNLPINSSTTFHFNDIISVKLDTAGELIWARNINKKQSYTYSSDTYVSYFSTIKNGASYIFINASEKIKELKNDRIEFKDVNPNNANLYLLTIDTKGVFNYQLLLSDDNNEVPFIVSKGISINDSCYFLGRKGKKKQLLKVTL